MQAALNSVTSLRGQLGAFQTATLDTNISTLTNAVTNLTAAQSDIQDADFASESANLSREQILVQSGTTVLGIASSNPAQRPLALAEGVRRSDPENGGRAGESHALDRVNHAGPPRFSRRTGCVSAVSVPRNVPMAITMGSASLSSRSTAAIIFSLDSYRLNSGP